MKELGYGRGYEYDHDSESSFSGQSFLPDSIEGKKFYDPGPYGFEKDIRKRMDYWENLKKKRKLEQ
jgi:putative ATPase